jgi:tripartite-type tricarboxylate transporter receptor subunit TctC
MRAHSAALLAVLLAAAPAAADPIADFYRGKTVRIIVGYGEGGGYDLYTRLAGLHIGRSIPGNPTVVVQNMPGAGTKVASRYIVNAAPKDGTVIGMVAQAVAQDAVLENTKDVDVSKFVWIGRLTPNIDMAVTPAASPIKTLADARSREVVLGSLAAGTTSVMAPTLLNAMAGTKFKLILGYKGSADVTLAMERGEVEGVAAIGWAGIKSSRPDWVAGKKINILYQVMLARSAELADVPAFGELGETPGDRAVLRFFASSADMGRSLFVAPGVPADRVAALRKAFHDMLADPEFIQDTRKRNIDIEPATGDYLAQLVADTLATPPAVVERMKAALGMK